LYQLSIIPSIRCKLLKYNICLVQRIILPFSNDGLIFYPLPSSVGLKISFRTGPFTVKYNDRLPSTE